MKLSSFHIFKLDRVRFADEPRKKHQAIIDSEVPMNLIAISEWDAPKKDYPENSSIDVKVELEKMAATINTYSPKQQAKLVKKHDEDFMKPFYKLITKNGYDFNFNWIEKVIDETSFIIVKLKYFYNRPRPYQLAPLVGIDLRFDMSDTAKSPSFPSGHALQSRLIANILSQSFPDLKKELIQIADEVAYSRWIGGFHFETDLQYGKELADWMINYVKYPNNIEESKQPNQVENVVQRGDGEDDRLVKIRQFKATIQDYDNYWNDRIKNGNF